MLCEALRALTYLHGLTPQVLHRDVKLENILVGSDMVVKLTDLGLCSSADPVGLDDERPRPRGHGLRSDDQPSPRLRESNERLHICARHRGCIGDKDVQIDQAGELALHHVVPGGRQRGRQCVETRRDTNMHSSPSADPRGRVL